MKTIKGVQSTVKPNALEFDEFHVYVYSDIKEVPEDERPVVEDSEGESPTLYSYNVTEYEKDEFLSALSQGQITLDNRATAIEDMILEMSGVVYA